MDLSFLHSEYSFGLNRGYLLFDRIGAPTTFLVAVNRYVVEQFGHDLVRADSMTLTGGPAAGSLAGAMSLHSPISPLHLLV